MKTSHFSTSIVALSIAATFAGSVFAQDASTVPAPAPQLSYGVPQIVQLSQAKISDATIIAYIQNSGNSYGLNANQIIYLRQQGVSDAVINTMLNQPKPASSAPAQSAQQNYSADVSTAVAQPTVTYVQSVPSSTVYVIPDTQTYRYNSYYFHPYPYYDGFYSPYYPGYPAVTFSFGFGGYHGGYYRGGGYHGGGWHHR